jgi:uncharacterized protein
MLLSDPAILLAAAIAVILVGLAKGGLSGLGALGTPVLALAVSPVEAAAVLLPVLIVQDAVSVWAYRRAWDGWIVRWMLPGALLGIAAAWWLAAALNEAVLMAALGVITLGFGLYRLWIERGGRIVAASTSPGWVGSLFGIGLGFASQIAHAGGPPFQMWVAPRRLPHQVFVGTGTILFAIVNWAKVPAYLGLHAFNRATLTASALLLPLAVVSTLAGVWVIRRLTGRTFYTIAYLLMVALGAKLIWNGIA